MKGMINEAGVLYIERKRDNNCLSGHLSRLVARLIGQSAATGVRCLASRIRIRNAGILLAPLIYRQS